MYVIPGVPFVITYVIVAMFYVSYVHWHILIIMCAL